MSVQDHFALFELPAHFEIDLADLEKRYLALSRQLHPDRHATRGAADRLASVQKTTDLNEAYRTLKDDFRRAELLLRMHGIETSEDKVQDVRTTVDTTLLMEVMELREALEEARGAKNAEAIAAMKADVDQRAANAWAEIREGFTALEKQQGNQLPQLARLVISLRYYRRILDEVADLEEL